jgi:hypothetical protein
MPTTFSPEELAEKARFVFRGRVEKLNAATLPEVRDTSNTGVVRVEETIQSPKSLSHYTGQSITVQFADPAEMKVGDEAVFFTNAWLFGNKGVAVRSVGQHPPGPQTVALRSTESDPVANLEDRDTQKHYDGADMVVSGKITSVRLLSDPNAAPSIREHDPDWQEAAISVDQVHKGDPAKTQIFVRFPASQDRMWHKAPKLQVGQRGYFLLHAGFTTAGTEARTPPSGAKPDFYTVLHPEDFESGDHPGQIQKLLTRIPRTGTR